MLTKIANIAIFFVVLVFYIGAMYSLWSIIGLGKVNFMKTQEKEKVNEDITLQISGKAPNPSPDSSTQKISMSQLKLLIKIAQQWEQSAIPSHN